MQLWLEITGAAYEIRENPGYYERLLELKEVKSSSVIKQIDRDLHRTFQNEEGLAESNFTSLRNVLIAYASRNPSVGYCQGLNFLVSRLLSLNLTEEETFWMVSQIIEIYLPVDYFSLMIGVLVDQKVFEHLLKKRLPAISEYLHGLSIDVSLFSVQWFVCIFAYAFQREVSLRIWDIFFVKGNKFLFTIALSLLNLTRDELMAVPDFEKALKFLQHSSKTFSSPEPILTCAQNKLFEINDSYLQSLRENFRQKVDRELDLRLDEVRPDPLIMRTISTFCETEDECQQKVRRTASYFTFSASSGMFIRENYIDDECIPRRFNTSQLRTAQEHLMLGSKNHVCLFEEAHVEKPDLTTFVFRNRKRRRKLLSINS